MSDYKRLTENEFDCSRCKDRKCTIPDAYCCDRLRCEIYNRLADLESKIGSRTLIEFNKLEFNKPFVVLDYTSNGKEYYAIRIVEERDLAINLTKEEAEARLKELQEKQE